jgi:hypothetical protein
MWSDRMAVRVAYCRDDAFETHFDEMQDRSARVCNIRIGPSSWSSGVVVDWSCCTTLYAFSVTNVLPFVVHLESARTKLSLYPFTDTSGFVCRCRVGTIKRNCVVVHAVQYSTPGTPVSALALALGSVPVSQPDPDPRLTTKREPKERRRIRGIPVPKGKQHNHAAIQIYPISSKGR